MKIARIEIVAEYAKALVCQSLEYYVSESNFHDTGIGISLWSISKFKKPDSAMEVHGIVDFESSVQLMELLKKINKPFISKTSTPEYEEYSERVINQVYNALINRFDAKEFKFIGEVDTSSIYEGQVYSDVEFDDTLIQVLRVGKTKVRCHSVRENIGSASHTIEVNKHRLLDVNEWMPADIDRFNKVLSGVK